MNKKTIIIAVTIAILALIFILYPKHKEVTVPEGTPIEALDRSTQYDTTKDIDSDLNSINVNASSSEEFKAMDTDIRSL